MIRRDGGSSVGEDETVVVMRDLKIMESGRTERGAREAPWVGGAILSRGSAIVLVLRSEDWISVREEEWMLRCATGEIVWGLEEVDGEVDEEVEINLRLVPEDL